MDKMHKGTVRKVEKERLRQVEKALVLVAQLGGATCIVILLGIALLASSLISQY